MTKKETESEFFKLRLLLLLWLFIGREPDPFYSGIVKEENEEGEAATTVEPKRKN